MIARTLFYYCKKVSILTNIWEIKNRNMEDITGADYVKTKKGCKEFGKKNIGEYHDLYIQSDTLLLADLFENF